MPKRRGFTLNLGATPPPHPGGSNAVATHPSHRLDKRCKQQSVTSRRRQGPDSRFFFRLSIHSRVHAPHTQQQKRDDLTQCTHDRSNGRSSCGRLLLCCCAAVRWLLPSASAQMDTSTSRRGPPLLCPARNMNRQQIVPGKMWSSGSPAKKT